MSIKSRLAKLEGGGRLFDPEDCPGETTCTLFYQEGEPAPAVPEDGEACPLCGAVHVLLVEEVVVTSREQADAMIGELSRQSGVKRQ